MKVQRKKVWSLSIFVCLLFVTAPAEGETLRTFVSIAPQKYFVQKIGGNRVTVSVLVPEGADPHTYEPKPRQMVELSRAAVFFAVGVELEKVWLRKIAGTNPKMMIVHTDDGIVKMPMTGHGHKHSAEGRQKEISPDTHIWLSPALVKIQAKHILQALIGLDLRNQSEYKERYDAFLREIDALDAELKKLFAGRKNRHFLVFHPSWGYFARDYGLTQIPIEIEGKEPKPADIQSIIRLARKRGIKIVFTQPQFSTRTAAIISKAIEGQVIYVNPLAENWSENLRDVGNIFATAGK